MWLGHRGRNLDSVSRRAWNLSRRGKRTQPGVSTPGIDKITPRPVGAAEGDFALPNREPDLRLTICRPFSISNPLRGCNSDLAQCSNTPVLHHSAWPDSRTTTSTRTNRLVRACSWVGFIPGVKTPGSVLLSLRDESDTSRRRDISD